MGTRVQSTNGGDKDQAAVLQRQALQPGPDKWYKFWELRSTGSLHKESVHPTLGNEHVMSVTYIVTYIDVPRLEYDYVYKKGFWKTIQIR